jgi:hypothetical protein
MVLRSAACLFINPAPQAGLLCTAATRAAAGWYKEGSGA